MRSGIYFILNKISLKLYIGSAIYLNKRKSEHFTRLHKNIHHNDHLQKAYNKYGPDAFDFIIVELASVDKLLELETKYIEKHKTINEDFGYNKCPFGVSALGRKLSTATIEKIRNSNKGKPKSKEHCLKISASLKGRKKSKEAIELAANKIRGRKRPQRTKEWIKNLTEASVKARHPFPTLTSTPLIIAKET